MKYVLLLVAAIGTVADLYLSPPNQSIWSFLATSLASTTWVVATIVAWDWAMGALNRTSPFMRKFFEEIRPELFVSVVGPLILLAAMFAGGKIALLHGVDLGAVGLGLMLVTLRELFRCIRLKIRGHKLRKSLVWALLWLVAIGIAYSTWLLRDVIDERLSTIQSMYLQISICCAALYAFYFASMLRFYLQEQRVEVSPVLAGLVEDVFGSKFSKQLRSAEEGVNSAIQDGKRAERQRLSQLRRKKKTRK